MHEYMHHLVIEQPAPQLKYRYNPAPSCIQLVSKRFATASNKRLIKGDQVRTFEITQRNLIFLPDHQDFSCYNGQVGSWRDSMQLVLNFKINEILDDMFRMMVHDLLHWIRCSIDSQLSQSPRR